MNIAIVGCGAIAQDHLSVIKELDELNLVALCDTDQETVGRTARTWNVGRYYTNFSDMLDKEELSIVSILTPPDTHAPIAIEAIRHGTNVLVEKPLTVTTSEAASILEALKGSKVKLTVDYNGLFSYAMMKALALIKQSAVGQILRMDVRMLQTRTDAMASNEKHWSHKLPGGRFGEMIAHPVYLLQSVLGNRLEMIKILADKRGKYDWMRYDELCVLLRGNSGIGQIYASFNAARPVYQIDIYGTLKILNIDLINRTLLTRGHRTFSKTDSAKDSLGISAELLLQTISNTLTFLRRERGQDALRRAYTSFLVSVGGRGELVVDADMAFHTVKAVEEICRAIDRPGDHR